MHLNPKEPKNPDMNETSLPSSSPSSLAPLPSFSSSAPIPSLSLPTGSESAAQPSQQQPALPVPAASFVSQDYSASSKTGNTQVPSASDTEDAAPFALTNPFRLPPARTALAATTTASEYERQGKEKSAGAKVFAKLFMIVKRIVLVHKAVEVQRWATLVYINIFLLHLPALYFMRVARVFQDAQLSREEVEQVVKRYRGVMALSPGLSTFKESWEALVDSLMREWKTLNVVTALLLTAILTLFQLPGVSTDPVLRNTSFLSLVHALLCLLYGCVYVIRFGSLRSMSKGLSWVYEAEESKSEIWWNIWVFLALPSLYFACSIVWFVVTVLGFIWQSGAVGNVDMHPPLSFKTALAPRIIITVQLVPGVVYFAMIVKMMWTHEMLAVGIAERGGV